MACGQEPLLPGQPSARNLLKPSLALVYRIDHHVTRPDAAMTCDPMLEDKSGRRLGREALAMSSRGSDHRSRGPRTSGPVVAHRRARPMRHGWGCRRSILCGVCGIAPRPSRARTPRRGGGHGGRPAEKKPAKGRTLRTRGTAVTSVLATVMVYTPPSPSPPAGAMVVVRRWA